MLFNANHLCNIERRFCKQRLTYTGGSGTPVTGQTVTGASSHSTAKITSVGTGYVVVKDLSDDFTVGETISTTTLSATLSAQADQRKSSGEIDPYWMTTLTGVRCRFWNSAARLVIQVAGVESQKPLRCGLPVSTGITAKNAEEFHIVATEAQFAGTYSIGHVDTYPGVLSGISHIEVTLQEP